MDRLPLAVFVALALMQPTVDAAIITDGNYVQMQLELIAGNGSAGYSASMNSANSSVDSGSTSVVNGAYSANGRAMSTLTGGPLLKARSASTAPAASGFFTPSSLTTARASWRDVLIPDVAGAPASVNLNFSVHARLAVSQTVASGISGTPNLSRADIRVEAENSILGFLNAANGLDAVVRNRDGAATETLAEDNSGFINWITTGFTALGANEYDFDGSFTYASPLLSFSDPSAPFGAYFIGVVLRASTETLGGTASSDAFNTLTLDSITLPGGGGLPTGINFAFESGAALATVPLPSSCLLLLSALLAGFTTRRLRFR